MPGEQTSMSSGDLKDVKHWISVYAELVEFKEKLLQQVHQQSSHVTDEGHTELESDEALLQSEARRLKRRLSYWKSALNTRG